MSFSQKDMLIPDRTWLVIFSKGIYLGISFPYGGGGLIDFGYFSFGPTTDKGIVSGVVNLKPGEDKGWVKIKFGVFEGEKEDIIKNWEKLHHLQTQFPFEIWIDGEKILSSKHIAKIVPSSSPLLFMPKECGDVNIVFRSVN